MEGFVTALFLLACVLATASVGTGVYDRRASRRLGRRDDLKRTARLLEMEIDVEAPGLRWQRLHALGGVQRRVALVPEGISRVALSIELRRRARVPFLARRWQGASRRIELVEGRVLAAEALLEPRLQRALADGPGQRATVELTHERVQLVLDTPPRAQTTLRRMLDQLAAIAELVESRIEAVDVAAHPARRLGFLPTAQPSGPTHSWPVHAPDGPRGHLVLSDAGLSLELGDDSRFISLERPFVVVMSRSHDVSGEPLLHLELRQQDDEATETHWTRLEVSARTRSLAASIEGLPEQGHRAPFLAEDAMHTLLARVRAASAAHGTPLERDAVEA